MDSQGAGYGKAHQVSVEPSTDDHVLAPRPNRIKAGAVGLLICCLLVEGLLGAAPAPSQATSQPAEGAAAPAAKATGGEELLLFEEMPVVVSASRQSQPVNWLSVPVSVITAQDIHYGGQRNVAEVLQFVPGMDVLRVDRNTYAVGIRGHHSLYSDRVLGLIDGRPVNQLAFGGIEWTRLPLLMEDIKSIEVVRGPAGAAWGANALSGVVNIITKDPEDTLGAFASTTINQFGDTYDHVRWAEKAGKWSYRVSGGYQNRTSSEDAIHDDDFDSRDFARNWVLDTKAIYRPSDLTKVTMGYSHLHEEGGDAEITDYWPRKRSRYELARSYVRVDRKVDNDTSGYLQWFGEYAESSRPQYCDRIWHLANDLEGQFNFLVGGNHHISVGGNVRVVDHEYRASESGQVFMDTSPYQEYSAGLFVMDRWQVTDRLVLEGQLRGDWYSPVQSDWAGRATVLYAVDAKKNHVLRFSTAKAFRTPSYAIRESISTRYPLGGGLYGYNLLKADDLVNEESWSIEAGYTGKLAEGLTLRVDPYYQRFDKLISSRTLPDPLGWGRTIAVMDNIAGADAYGVECELAWVGKAGKLSAWYAYNGMATDQTNQSMRAFRPSPHKAGLSGRLFLPQGWTLNANYRYVDTTAKDETMQHGYGSFHRFDIGVAKEVFKGHGEVMIGVDDILNTTDGAVYEVGAITGHETPGRTFFVRLQVSF